MAGNHYCMVCKDKISTDEITFICSENVAVLNNLFYKWCKHMEVETNGFQYDFGQQVFPFCKPCRILLVRLNKLKVQMVERQEKCKSLAMTMLSRKIPCGNEAKYRQIDRVPAQIRICSQLFNREESDVQSYGTWKGRSCSASLPCPEQLFQHMQGMRGNPEVVMLCCEM